MLINLVLLLRKMDFIKHKYLEKQIKMKYTIKTNDMKPQDEITNWQKVLIYLDENKDKHFTDQIADLMEIYNLTKKDSLKNEL